MNVQESLNIIDELVTVYRVTKGPSGEFLSQMDYQSLVRLLAVKRAVAS